MLTVGRLREVAKKSKYLILRSKWNQTLAVNTIAFFKFDNKKYKNEEVTCFVSFRECTIQEYISKKIAFKQ